MAYRAYDAAYPPVDAINSSGAAFVCCYTDGQYATPVETINRYISAGLGILPNHERSTGQLLGGYSAGVEAANQCMSNIAGWQCPQDGSVAIFYSVDQWVDPLDYYLIAQAFTAIRATHAGRWKASIYGQGGLIDYLAAGHLIDVKGWLSASSSFPGYDIDSPNVGMYQLVGSNIAGTDQNVVKDPTALGVWYPAGVTPPGGGAPIGDDMIDPVEWETVKTQVANIQTELQAMAAQYLGGANEIDPSNSTSNVVNVIRDNLSSVGSGINNLQVSVNAIPSVVAQAIEVALAKLPAAPGAPTHYTITLNGKADPA